VGASRSSSFPARHGWRRTTVELRGADGAVCAPPGPVGSHGWSPGAWGCCRQRETVSHLRRGDDGDEHVIHESRTRSSMRTVPRGSACIAIIHSSEGLSRPRGSSAPALAPQEVDHLGVDLGEALLLHPVATAGEQHTNLAKFSGVCSILDEHELWNYLSGITRGETSVTMCKPGQDLLYIGGEFRRLA